MSSKVVRLAVLSAVSVFAARLAAAQVQLAAVQFPESSSVELKLIPTNRVAPAEAEADVKFKNGQAAIEVEWERLPPAVLFGGDVTSYVTWAVGRDGTAENLGELPVRKPKGDIKYSTGQKEFALMVTAEPHPLVLRPSDLVVLTSVAPPAKKARSTPFTMTSFSSAAKRGNEQIGGLTWSGTDPIDLVQAQHILQQAQAIGAEQYNADAIREATTALAQASNSYKAGNQRVGTDYARRSVNLSSTAIRDTQKRLAQQAADAEAARRAAELQALEQQRTAAQRDAAAAQQQALTERERALAAREQAIAAQAQLAQQQQQLSEQRQAADAQSQVTTLAAAGRAGAHRGGAGPGAGRGRGSDRRGRGRRAARRGRRAPPRGDARDAGPGGAGRGGPLAGAGRRRGGRARRAEAPARVPDAGPPAGEREAQGRARRPRGPADGRALGGRLDQPDGARRRGQPSRTSSSTRTRRRSSPTPRSRSASSPASCRSSRRSTSASRATRTRRDPTSSTTVCRATARTRS